MTDPDKPPLTPLYKKGIGARCMHLFEGGVWKAATYLSLLLLLLAGCAVMVEVGEADDFTMKFVSGSLGASSLLAFLLGASSVFKENSITQNLTIAWAAWVIAQCAVLMQGSLREYGKNDRFCSITGIPGIPDGDCSARENRAMIKIIYAIMIAVLESFIMLAMLNAKDELSRSMGAVMVARAAPLGSVAGGGGLAGLAIKAKNDSRARVIENAARNSSTPALTAGAAPQGSYTNLNMAPSSYSSAA
mmetsp:Transcript_63797/g.201805  ORF Transcript_63797/g.201805 Transcript_63797/m.201805 type:complete len:247 (+) Transcript_63797:406-1146(+)